MKILFVTYFLIGLIVLGLQMWRHQFFASCQSDTGGCLPIVRDAAIDALTWPHLLFVSVT